MINNKFILFVYICFLSTLLLGEKSSKDIQKDIDKKNQQLNNLKMKLKMLKNKFKKKSMKREAIKI